MSIKNVLKSALGLSLCAAFSLLAIPSANAVTIYGSVIFSSDDGEQAIGMHSFDTTSATSITSVAGGENVLAHGGGVLVDGYYYAINADKKRMDVYDVDTWTLERSQSGVTPALDLTYNVADGKVYGTFSDSNAIFGILDITTGSYSAIGVMRIPPVALVSDSAGRIYCIGMDGNLYTVDKTTAEMTAVGPTGVAPFSVQSAVIDADSGKCYWAASRGDYSSGLYEVDLSTGNATLIYDFPFQQEITGLYISPEIPALAPGRVTDLKAEFEGGSTSGAISFTMPALTASGDQLSGSLAWSLLIDGEMKKSGTAAAGAPVSVQLSLPQGNHKFSVSVSNSAGEGRKVIQTKWIGHDTPMPVSGVYLHKDGADALTLSWTLPAAGVHGGYVDHSALSCKVARYPGDVAVDVPAGKTSVSDRVEAPRLAPYWYEITVEANGLVSEKVSSNRVTMGAAKTIPYSEDFSSTVQFGNIMITDANADGMAWGHNIGAERATYPGQIGHAADDWMVTPPLALSADRNYRLRFDVCPNSFDPHTIEVKLGSLPNIGDLTKEVIPVTEVAHPYEWRTIEMNFHVDRDGDYYLGMHLVSPSNHGSLDLDNLSVESIGSSSAPQAPAGLKAVAFAGGKLGADITLTAPEKAVDGSVLTGTMSVALSRDGEQIKLFENVTAGAELTFSDTGARQGFNLYEAVATNGSGAGEISKVKTFVGIDYPGEVENINVTEGADGHVTVEWQAPAAGVNGGYIDASALTYTVKRNGWKEIAKDVKGLSVEDFVEESLAMQMIVGYTITAQSVTGEGAEATSDAIVAGAPYETPFKDSFAGGRPSTSPWASLPLGTTNVWQAWADGEEGIKSQDGDGGTIVAVSYIEQKETMHLLSPKIRISNTVNPVLEFYVASTPADDELEIDLLVDGVATHVEDISLSGGISEWRRVTVPLTAYTGNNAVQLSVTVDNIGFNDRVYLDAVTLVDDIETNLAAGAIELPVRVTAGVPSVAKASVINVGRTDVADYKVELYKGDELLATVAGVPVKAGATAVVDLPFTPSSAFGQTFSLHTVVVCAADENNGNNTSKEVSVPLEVLDLPLATHLEAKTDGTSLALQWQEPVIPEGYEVTTEDFESMKSFTITEFGDWKAVEGDPTHDSAMEFTNSNNEFIVMPGDYAWANYAFTVVDLSALPRATSADGWNCVSGSKFLMTTYSAAMYTGTQTPYVGDYLISPRLNGTAQTITVNVKSLNYNDWGKERIQILVSSTDSELASFSLLEDVKNVPSEWTALKFDLPEGTRYFAVYSVKTETALFIDDISYIADGATAACNYEILGYNIYRDSKRLNAELLTTPAFTDTTADEQKTYEYAVSAVYTAGESALSVPVSAGIAGIAGVEADGSDAPAEYFNLQGVRVENPAPGIYIRRQGASVSKVVVK